MMREDTFGAALTAAFLLLIPLPSQAQQAHLPFAHEVNREELRLLIASAIPGGLVRAESSDRVASSHMDVWINAQGRADSVIPVATASNAPFGAVIAGAVGNRGRFNPAIDTGWRRWVVQFTLGELRPRQNEPQTCPTSEALRALLLTLVGEIDLRAHSDTQPHHLEVPPVFGRSSECSSILVAVLDTLTGHRTSRGSTVCREAECPDSSPRIRRAVFEDSELTWLTSAWTIRVNGTKWFVDCTSYGCNAWRPQIIS